MSMTISTRSNIASVLAENPDGLITTIIHQQLIARNWHTEKSTLVTIISQMVREGYLSAIKKQCECCGVARKAYRLLPKGKSVYGGKA